MESSILEFYTESRDKIRNRLNDFKNLQEKDYFKEFLFCLLTPQSNAQRCWQAVELIYKLKNPVQNEILNILKTRTRFHITKTKYIIEAQKNFEIIKPLLDSMNRKELRNLIAERVKGFGLKEASHFLRNIGKSDNGIAILDRHILRNLHKHNIINEPKIKTKNQYLEIESLFLDFAYSISIPPDELDLLWWGMENGEIFK